MPMSEIQAIQIKQAVLDWLEAYEVAVIKPGGSSSSDADFLEGWIPNKVSAFDHAIRWAEAGRTVLYLSLDVSLCHKLSTHFCQALEMEIWKIKRGWLSKQTMERLASCIRRLQKAQILCADPDVSSPGQIQHLLKSAHELHGARCVAIDGLGSVLSPLNTGSKSRLTSTADLLAQLREMQQMQGYAEGAFAM